MTPAVVLFLSCWICCTAAADAAELTCERNLEGLCVADEQSKASSMLQRRSARTRSVVREGAPTEEEKAEWLMMASFGPSRQSMQAMGRMSFAEWINDQVSKEPTSHRAYYRARVNSRAGIANMTAMPRSACAKGSRWINYAFSRKDEGLRVTVSDSSISVGEQFRTKLGKGSEWASLSFSGYVCDVDESVGGDVLLKKGNRGCDTTCSSSSCKTLPNPALMISPSKLFTETSLSFVTGPKEGVILLAAEAEGCDLGAKPFIKYQDLYYLHDPRLALVSNVVDDPAEGHFDPYYFMIDGRDQERCRPHGLDIWGSSTRGTRDGAEVECKAASEELGYSYQGKVSSTEMPRGCLVDSAGSYFNTHYDTKGNSKYQIICKRPCPVVAKSPFNKAGCRIASACGGSKSVVCGSPGEVASEPIKGHRFTSYVLDDAGQHKYDAKRDPMYARDWANGLDKSVVWTMVALNAEDQLRQRVAWALSQIIVTSEVGFGYGRQNEMWLNFYDIFVRHAFGSFRDLLKEITYSPIMADYLTYWGSQSFDMDGKYPDENYAREVMQLFTIGQWRLNMDGSIAIDADGEPVLNYDNEDIMNFARVFTGFEMQPDRGNKEREETARNYVDPMYIIASRRDIYPKPDLHDNYLGDGVPLCEDLPPQPFLLKGAKFEFVGFSYSGSALEVEAGSGLYDALQAAEISKELPSSIECSGALCDLETIKVIKVGSAYYEFLPPVCVDLYFFNAQVVEQSGKRFGDARYATCANPVIAQASPTCCTTAALIGEPKPALAQANVSFARGNANHEYFTYLGAKARCEKQGMEICGDSTPTIEAEIPVWTSKACHSTVAVDDLGRVAAQKDAASKENWFMPAWENDEFPMPDDCPSECQGYRVPVAGGDVVQPWKVVGDYVELPKTTEESASQGHIEISMECSAPAYVAFEAFIFATDKYSDSYVLELAGFTRDWNMGRKNRWFWSQTSPGLDVGTGTHSIIIRGKSDSGIRIKSLQLVRGSDSCALKASKTAVSDSCVCPMSVEQKVVFDTMPTADDVLDQLYIGAFKPEPTSNVQTSGGVKAYLTGGVFDTSTVFEYKGHFYKNMESVVHVGNSFSFRNAPVYMNPLYPTVHQAEAEVDAFLDHLVDHPNTPPFIAYRLIQRFTTSNPSGDYVQAVAEAFVSGAYKGTVYSNKRGDLKAAMVATLLHGQQKASLAETSVDSGAAQQAPPPQASLRLLAKRSATNVSAGCANTRRNPLETSREYSSTFRNQKPGTGLTRSMLFSVSCWTPNTKTLGEWMQINLEEALEVSGVVVQGRVGRSQHWVKTYKVSISEDGSSWTDLPDTFDGSVDTDTPVEAIFSEPKLAKHVRITPQTWNGKMAMRAALLVCDSNCAEWDVRLTNVQGSKGNPEIFFDGAFRPLCGNRGYWGKQESTYFCQSLGAKYKAYRKTNEAFDVDAVEARDWQKFHGSGLTSACTASKAIGTEIECSGELERTSTCPEPPTPAPTPVPEGVLQFQIKSAGGQYPGVPGLSEFYLNKEDLHGPDGNGFNIVTLSPAGEVQSMSTWDTYAHNDMKFFVDFLSKLRHGTIVLLSMKNRGTLFNPGNDASKQFIKTSVQEALDSLGATDASSLGTKMPYVLIAKKGFPGDAHQSKGNANDDGLVKLEVELSEEAWPDAPTPTEGSGVCGNWDVRLVDVIGTRGTAEVYMSGNWQPLCWRNFQEESAVEFCEKLGATSGQFLRADGISEKDAVEVRTWGELKGGGLTEICETGKSVTMWIQCSGDELVKHSSCAPMEPQVCAFEPLASEACPCEHGNHGSCDLPECSFGMVPGDLCEADQPLPDGKQDFEVNNCAEHYDVFQYRCQAPRVPAPAPTPPPEGGLHLLVKSGGYHSGFGGTSAFYLNGASLDGTNDRGINVVVLTATGAVVSRANFDLGDWNDAVDTVNTASFVQALTDVEDGSIVLISVKNNAWTDHAENDVQASLKGLGARKPFLSNRAPYVLIVKKGFPGLGIYEELGPQRDYRVLSVEGWFPTTTPPTVAPTAPPTPAPPAAPAPTPPLSSDDRTALQQYGKLREPVLKIMHFLRAMEYEEADPDRDVVFEKLDSFIGQWVFKSPSVFNYYTPEYSPMSFNGDLVAPEFEIFTPPHAMGFLNGMVQALKWGLSSCDGGLGRTQFSCKEEQGKFAFKKDGSLEDVLQELDLLLTAGRLGKNADAQVVKDAYNEAAEGSKLEAAQQAILFTPEFNVLGNTMPKQEKRQVATEDAPTNTAPKPYRAVVKLFLLGGMDSFNLLVPLDCHLLDEYSIARSDIALQPNTLHRISNTGQECSSFGIHPVMDILKELYDDGDAAFIANIGGLVEPLTKDQWHRGAGRRCMGLFSHSNQQMGAQTLDCQSSSAISRGAGGRLGDGLARQSGGSTYRTSSFSVAGSATWSQGFETHIEVLDDKQGSVRLREYESLKSVIGNITQVQHGQVYSEEYVSQLGTAVENSEELGAILDTVTLTQDWNKESSLARQLQQVAKMIKTRDMRKAERDLYFVTLGGFDHHNEVLAALQEKLSEVNSALKSFVAELKDMGAFDEVTLTSASDFGRTLTSNGAGSDHGWAGNHFIIGGSVRGGKIYNKFPKSLLEGNSQDAGRGRMIPQYPWENMEVPVAQWMGLDASQFEYVYPNYANFNSSHFIQRSDLFVN